MTIGTKVILGRMASLLTLVLSALLGAITAHAAVSVTPASGGSSISADFTGGTYTNLTGPMLSEGATADIGPGTIVLNAPPGFHFDTGGSAPTVLMTRISGSGPDSRNINDVASGTSIAITSRTSSQITFTVTAASANSVRCSLTWQNVRVRPTAGTPLASGDLTKSGASTISGVTGSTNLGTLTEVAGAAVTLVFTSQPASAVVGAVFGTQPVVKTRDQFGNNTASGLPANRNVTLTLTGGTGPLQGTATLDIGTAAGNGTVTFTNLRIDVVGADKQLTAAASSLTSGVSSVFTVSQGSQTISFGALSNKTYGDADFTLGATASSSLSVTYSIISGPATVLGNTVTLTGAGTVTVRASQAGDTNWSAAADVDRSFTVSPKALTVSGVTASNKIYDGNTTATLNTGSAALVGVIGSDVVTLDTGGAAGAFATKTVGTGKTVTASGLMLGGAQAANYTLTQPTPTADITAKALTVSGITANNKVYDGNTTATLNTGSAALVGVNGGDTVNLNTGSAAGAFATKTVAAGKPVTVSGLTTSGGDAGNYNLTQPGATADITVRALTVSATGVSKVYDGTTTATVTLADDRLGGDDVTTTYTAADFADETAGTGKSVSVSGIAISGGADAGNYAANATASASADITAKGLTVTGITANNKIYDGHTAATLNTGSATLVGVVGGDTVNLNVGGAAGAFATKTVGTGKPVTVSGITISGGDSGNYSLTQPSATADITVRGLTVSATGVNKAYDGTTTATVILADNRVGGDDVTTTYAAAAFADETVGTGKSVSVSGIVISGGADAGNYAANATASATADITAKALTVSGVTASNKVYDGNTTATLNTGSAALVGVVGGDSLTLDTGSASGAFADKNAGTAKVVTASGLTLGGADAGNYSLTQPTTTADITALAVSLSGTCVYDGTVEAAAGILTIDNNLDSPNLTLTGSATLASKTIGTRAVSNRVVSRVQSATGNSGSGTVTSFGVTLGSAPVSGNTLVAVIATRGSSANRVTSITQTGATWSRAAQAANGNGTTTEIWYAPNVNNAGTAITINQASLRSAAVVMEYSGVLSVSPADQTASATGNSAAGVTGTTPTTSQANELWIGSIGLVNSGFTLGTPNNAFSTVTSAQSSHGTDGNNAKVYALEKIVTATGTAASGGTISSSSQWSGAVATFRTTPLGLGGSAAGNYTLTGLSGSVIITAKNLTVSGMTANTKVYDGNTSATLNTGSAALVGAVSTDAVTLNTAGAVGTFSDPNIGTGKTVTISGLSISGADAGNYTLTQPTTTADITTGATTVQFQHATTTWDETNTPVGIVFTVSNAAASVITVNYDVTGGTADNGGGDSDYSLADGIMSFPVGVTSTTLYFTVVNDARDEHDQTIILQLSGPVNASLGSPTTHTVTLVDEDPLPEITFAGAPYTVAEGAGNKTVTVTLSHQSDKDMRVWHATSNGTAEAGSDYTATSGNVRWPPPSNGDTKIWTIPILDDGRAEGDQYFTVCLVDTQNCAIPALTACTTVTIIDDDFAPVVTSGSGIGYPTSFEATLNGNLTSTGTAATTVGFYWGPSHGGSDASLWADSRQLSVQDPGPFSTTISNLVSGQTYYYTAFATNSAGEAWSDVVAFIGRGNEAPEILDSSVTNRAVTTTGTIYTGPTPVLTAGLPLPTWSVDAATAALGITADPNSGVLTWTTTVFSPNPYTLTIVASNAFGIDTASWQLRVVPAGEAVYVSAAGSDVAGDGSPMRPFATLTNAIANRAALTNIYVSAGTYPIATQARLSSSEPLRIVGGYDPTFFTHDPLAWATILDGGNAARSDSLLASSATCNGLVLQHFAGTSPILAQVSDVSMTLCLVRDNSLGSAAFEMNPSGRLTLDRCRFYDNQYSIGGNLVYGANADWSLFMVNSVFANGTGGARVCEAVGGAVVITGVNCTYYNATLTDNGVSYWRPSGPSVVHTQAFYNCLFWTANNGATQIKDSGTLGTVIIENGVFRTSGGQPWQADDLTLVSLQNKTGIAEVPFASESTSDADAFKPGHRETPTRDAGKTTAQNALVPLTDLAGNPRLGVSDVGAYEWTVPDTTVFRFW